MWTTTGDGWNFRKTYAACGIGVMCLHVGQEIGHLVEFHEPLRPITADQATVNPTRHTFSGEHTDKEEFSAEKPGELFFMEGSAGSVTASRRDRFENWRKGNDSLVVEGAEVIVV